MALEHIIPKRTYKLGQMMHLEIAMASNGTNEVSSLSVINTIEIIETTN